MRTFIASVNGHGTKKDPHYLNVIEVKKSEIVRLGFREFSRQSTKGEESEVYALLHEQKIVSDDVYIANNGYYSFRDKDIRIIIV